MNLMQIAFLLGMTCRAGEPEALNPPSTGAPVTHRVYSTLMNPREHPDHLRYQVQPPGWDVFKNRTQFTCLRGFNVVSNQIVGYQSEIEKFTRTHQLGDVLWPSYPILFAQNLREVATEIRQRELYLFDIWGYVPGSGPGGYWQQFQPPQEAFRTLESILGERWLGTDIGEQDGRYIGGYANQMTPASGNRLQQYWNFQRHFERMGDDLGHRHATLVSLNFGHYFLKEGTYTLIGAETAQALPNNQVYYAFIRGAGKQYGVPWFGNASIFNRWGFKTYGSSGKSDGYEHGPTKGTSLSLLQRLLYTHILYNSVAVGFENGWFDGEQLSPIGRIQQDAQRWVKANGQPGVMHTPVALLLDFFSGWSFPRHLYSGNTYRVWGNLPYDDGDHLTDALLDLLYPGYQDSSFFHDESGFITPTPYGDIADCLLSDAPGWLLDRYPVIILAGTIDGNCELRDKLERYVRKGGHLLLTEAQRDRLPGGLPGTGDLRVGDTARHQAGRITLFAKGKGLVQGRSIPVRSEIDQPLPKPLVLEDAARKVLDAAIREQSLFDVGNPRLSLVTCRRAPGEYTLGLANNSWREEPFRIVSNCGPVSSVEELSRNISVADQPGYRPESMANAQLGRNSSNTITGGDIRIFRVRVQESNVQEIGHESPPARPSGRFIPVRRAFSLREELLSRPTFFQSFDGMLVDGAYLQQKEVGALLEEGRWIQRQKLRVIVDLSPDIDLYPALRLLNNLESDYTNSLATIRGVLAKMGALGATDLVLSLHRHPENNFTDEQTRRGFEQTLRTLASEAAQQRVKLHLRVTFGKPPWNLQEAAALLDRVNAPNLQLAPSTALVANRHPSDEEKAIATAKVGLWMVAGAENDAGGQLWNVHQPLHKSRGVNTTNPPGEGGHLSVWLRTAPSAPVVFDAVYDAREEEYLDAACLTP